MVDFGVGLYEFWGAPGVDSQPEVVSNCCEAAVIDVLGNRVGMEDYDDDWNYEVE